MDPPVVTCYGRPAYSSRPVVVTGFPGAGKSLLWEMLKHCVSGYEFADAWSGARDGVISKAAHALLGDPAESGHHVIMVRNPRVLLSLKNEGEHILSAHSCRYRGCSDFGLCEWWDRIKRFSYALIIHFEDLVASPLRLQITLAQRFGLTFKQDRFFDQISVKDSGSVDHQRVDRVKQEHPEILRVIEEMGYE